MGWVRSNLSEVKRLKARLGGGRRVVELADGSRFYFEPEKVFEVMFMFLMNSLRAIYEGIERPEAPEIVRAIAGAVDRERAFRTVFPKARSPCP